MVSTCATRTSFTSASVSTFVNVLLSTVELIDKIWHILCDLIKEYGTSASPDKAYV